MHRETLAKIIIHHICIGREGDSVIIQRRCFSNGVRCRSMPYRAHALLIFRDVRRYIYLLRALA